MATASDYAKWIVDNQDKKGTPEFDTVARAYQAAKGQVQKEPVPEPVKTPLQEPVNPRDYGPFAGKENPYSLRNIAAAPIDAGLALGTSGLAASKGGWDAVYAYLKNELIGRGMEGEITDPTQMTANAVQKYGYQPRTSGGQAILEAIAAPLQAYAEKGTEYADRAQQATGSPMYGAGTEAMWHLLPSVLGAKNVKIPYATARKSPVTEAIINRLPGGTKNAATEILKETTGPRIGQVRKALVEADKKLTAGQATTPAGSHETSALFKMAEKRDPSAYSEIRQAQEAKRIGKLRGEAKSPETQAYMENIQKGVSDKLYDAARKGEVPKENVQGIVNKIDKLIEDNVGNQRFVSELTEIKKGLVSKEGVRTNAKQVFSTVDGLRIALNQQGYGPIKGQLNSLKKEIAGLTDQYKQAEQFYAQTSRPLTQMGIFQELIDTLTPKLGSKEKATQYVNAITGRTQALTMKKASGGKKPIAGEFEAALKPEQSNLIKRIGEELDNNAKYSEQAISGAVRMNEMAGTMWNSPKVTILERGFVVFNAILKRVEGRNARITLEKLADLGKPENRAELVRLLDEAMPEELAILQQSSMRVGRLAPGAIAGAEAGEQ